ncbi:MAG: ABC transporter permease subunit [Oscillospiraceae bacterium]|nr:ABC transporter permease subunit [Oscillospiraceae bacterium]
MKNIMTIIKKEFARFFGDYRLALSTLLLPGLMIFGIYWLIGEGMQNLTTEDPEVVYDVAVYNMPEEVREGMMEILALIEEHPELFPGLSFPNMNFHSVDNRTVALERLEYGYYDLLAVFPAEFTADPGRIDEFRYPNFPQKVMLHFDATVQDSDLAFRSFSSLMSAYHGTILPQDVLFFTDFYNIADDAAMAGMALSMMLPMLILIFLFQSCMGLTPESIAGEKERGTIATMLVTPIKRSEFAIGKVASLSVISLLAGISSFIGIILAMPMMLGDEIGMGDAAAAYTVMDYVWLLTLVLTTVILIVALMSLVSAFAKSVKEATGILTPVMMVGMVAAFVPMFAGNMTGIYWYMIPFVNTTLALTDIFAFDYSVANVAVVNAMNLVLAAVFIFVLTKLFNSEKVMFRK